MAAQQLDVLGEERLGELQDLVTLLLGEALGLEGLRAQAPELLAVAREREPGGERLGGELEQGAAGSLGVATTSTPSTWPPLVRGRSASPPAPRVPSAGRASRRLGRPWPAATRAAGSTASAAARAISGVATPAAVRRRSSSPSPSHAKRSTLPARAGQVAGRRSQRGGGLATALGMGVARRRGLHRGSHFGPS